MYQDLGQGLEEVLLPLAWRIVNDSFRTDVCLLFPPFQIALASLHMASVILGKLVFVLYCCPIGGTRRRVPLSILIGMCFFYCTLKPAAQRRLVRDAILEHGTTALVV